MNQETVFIHDPIHPTGVERIKAGHRLVEAGDLTAVTALVIRTSALTPDWLAAMPNLRLIVKHGAGVDNIPMEWATQHGIMVANTPGGSNSTAVAEGALTLMLATFRRVREMDDVVRGNRWDARWDTRLGDLTGARVGLVGFGRIARAVARICSAGFGCSIVAYDPMLSDDEIRAGGAEPLTLEEVMACDVISIHVPLTDETRLMISAAQIALMPPHGVIVNTSRGGIIDEAALAEALSTDKIGGAGIDVFEAEPPPADHPLFGLSNVVLSPHVAGVTEASMRGMALAVADVIDTVAAGGIPDTLLNEAVQER